VFHITKHFFGDLFEHNSGEFLVTQWWFIVEGHRVLVAVNTRGCHVVAYSISST
jgi:hypothetical protein